MHDKRLKCLIIGGGGFIGSWLAKNLTDKGHIVSILDPHFNYFQIESTHLNKIYEFRSKYLLKNVRKYSDNFDDKGLSLISKNKYHVIIHLAAHAADKPFDSEMSKSQITKDIELTYNIVSAIRKVNNKTKLVFMSSSAVYGAYEYATVEYAQINPTSTYGISKAAGELIVKTNLLNWNIIRSNATYGYGDLGERATYTLVNKAFNKQKAWVNDSVWVDFIYVKDLVEGISQVILKSPNKEIYNISGGKPYKLLSYVEEINKYLPFEYEIKSLHDRPNRGVLDNSKARMVLGWEPIYNLGLGVKDYMRYIRKYKTV